MKNKEIDQLRAALKALGAPPVTVPHVLADFAGGLEAGAVVAGLLFWSDKGKREDGFFWKSYGDWWQERRVREHTVRRVTRELASRGLIEIKLVKAYGAPTLHYRVTSEMYRALSAFIADAQAAARSSESPESDSAKSKNPNLGNQRISSCENAESITAVTQPEQQPATRARTEDGETATDAVLRIASRIGLTKAQRGRMTALLELEHKRTFREVLALGAWAETQENPARAFIGAAEANEGRPFPPRSNGRPAQPPTSVVSDDGKRLWLQGTGWMDIR